MLCVRNISGTTIYAEKRPGKMVMMAGVEDLAEGEKERLKQIGISYTGLWPFLDKFGQVYDFCNHCRNCPNLEKD